MSYTDAELNSPFAFGVQNIVCCSWYWVCASCTRDCSSWSCVLSQLTVDPWILCWVVSNWSSLQLFSFNACIIGIYIYIWSLFKVVQNLIGDFQIWCLINKNYKMISMSLFGKVKYVACFWLADNIIIKTIFSLGWHLATGMSQQILILFCSKGFTEPVFIFVNKIEASSITPLTSSGNKNFGCNRY